MPLLLEHVRRREDRVHMNRWEELTGRPSAREYAARFERLAASGADAHGEASCVVTLAPAGSRVLDAGCGTGRVAIELHRRGYDCVGVDVDESMLGLARAAQPDVPWYHADLAELDLLGSPEELAPFDVVVTAGNVIPLLAPGTESEAIRRLSRHLRPDGLLVAGFGLDAAHLPIREAPFTIDEYDAWCAAAEVTPVHRWSTWDGDPFAGSDGGYAVSVHRRVAHVT